MATWNVNRDGPNWLMNAAGQVIGYRDKLGREYEIPQIAGASGDAEGFTEPAHRILTEVSPVVQSAATGLIFTGAGLYGGVKFRAITGTVILTLYDALSAVGVPIDTITNASLTGGNGTGYYDWSGNKLRPLTTGLWGVLSGGGTFTADVLVS